MGSVAPIHVIGPPVQIGLALLAMLFAGLSALLPAWLLALLALTLLVLAALLAALLGLAGALLLAALHVLVAALLLITLALILARFVLFVCHRGVSSLGKSPIDLKTDTARTTFRHVSARLERPHDRHRTKKYAITSTTMTATVDIPKT